MTDRELLELAAKAAGIKVWWNGRTCFLLETNVATHEWNPLTDDGDALRLTVKLRMDVCSLGGGDSPSVIVVSSEAEAEEFYTDDPHAATRRAIVRAAAEIGRSMK